MELLSQIAMKVSKWYTPAVFLDSTTLTNTGSWMINTQWTTIWLALFQFIVIFTEGKTEAQTNNVLKVTQVHNERHSIEFYISKTLPGIPINPSENFKYL